MTDTKPDRLEEINDLFARAIDKQAARLTPKNKRILGILTPHDEARHRSFVTQMIMGRVFRTLADEYPEQLVSTIHTVIDEIPDDS